MKKSSMTVGSILVGERDSVCKAYIKRALRNPDSIDPSVLFITYVGMKLDEVEAVKEEAMKIVKFEKVYLQKASPAVSINSGPGTFGLIFSKKDY